MLTVIDLNGKPYPAEAQPKRNRQINGERTLSLSFLRSDLNDKFLPDIETMWTCSFHGDRYHLFNPKEDAHGNKSFDAVLDFFHYFNGIWHVDEVDDKSMTINDSVRPLFDGKKYALNIIDNFYANTMNYSKQQNSTERFLYFIGRHNAEFNIPIGTQTVQIRNRIGVRRNDVLIHEDDKLIDFNIDTSSESFCTAIRGYYDFKAVDEMMRIVTKKSRKRRMTSSAQWRASTVSIGDSRFTMSVTATWTASRKPRVLNRSQRTRVHSPSMQSCLMCR